MPNPKKGPHSGYFWQEHPLFGPESCVFEIALVILVGVGTYEKILRSTQNPTLAGMDPLSIFLHFVHHGTISYDKYITSDDKKKYMDYYGSGVLPEQTVINIYNEKYQKTYSSW